MVIIFGIVQDLSTDYRLYNVVKSLEKEEDNILFYVNSPENRKREYFLNGICVREFKLPFKGENKLFHIFVKQAYLLLLAFRMYTRTKCKMWFFDEEVIPVSLFFPGSFVLDLHEIPYKYLSYPFSKGMLRLIERRSKYIIHANDVRCEYMLGLVFKYRKKNIVFHNYLNSDMIPMKIRTKSSVKPKIYIQGLSQDERFPCHSLEVVLVNSDWEIVLVGSVTSDAEAIINANKNRITYHGKVMPSEIPAIMNECDCSLVFYSSDKPNTDLCAPNRLYWALALGLPVITGNNTTFRELHMQGAGIFICDTAGSDFEIISKGIMEFGNQLSELQKTCQYQAKEYIFNPTKNHVFI
jgi:hypothetical protein